MVSISFSFEKSIADWTRSLDDVAKKQIPFATALALTETAKEVKDVHKDRLPTIFDRPTTFTINALQAVPAKKDNLVSSVRLKDMPRYRNHYLHWSIEGLPRGHKAFEKWLIGRGIMAKDEFAVPAKGVRLNNSGNMSPGTITAILSQLKVSPDAMQWETSRSRAQAAKKGRARYFVPQRGSKLPRGVWQRTGKNAIKPVLIFVSAVGYKKQYDFYGISERESVRRFPALFGAALARAIATAR